MSIILFVMGVCTFFTLSSMTEKEFQDFRTKYGPWFANRDITNDEIQYFKAACLNEIRHGRQEMPPKRIELQQVNNNVPRNMPNEKPRNL